MTRRMSPKCAALEVLRALEDASEASEGRMGFSFSMADWDMSKKVRNARSPPYCERSYAYRVSELSTDLARLEYITRLCEALKKSAFELLAIHRREMRPIALKFGKSVAALPDELLGLIFKFATHDEQEGTRHAHWLSQVSQRFRRIALADQTLWKTQFQWYDYFESVDIDRCIGRCDVESDLHIVVNFDSCGFSQVSKFAKNCYQYAARWKSLTWTRTSVRNKENNPWSCSMSGLVARLWADVNLKLPQLHELCIIQNSFNEAGQIMWNPLDDEEENGIYDWWRAPNLRVLKCHQYIPPRPFPYQSLTDLTMSLTLTHRSVVDQMTRLCAFLVSKPNLLVFNLNLVDHKTAQGNVLALNITVPLLSLKAFKLTLTKFKSTQWIVEPFVKALQMPSLERYTLSTDFIFFPTKLLFDPARYPNITTLTMDASRFDRKKAVFYLGSAETLKIPLDKIPNASSLTLTTLQKVIFSRRGLRAEISDQGRDRNAYNSADDWNGSCLRELCLRSCTFTGIEDLWETVLSLKRAGVWNQIERVAIQTCDLLEYDAVVEVIGKERLYFSRS